MNTKKILITGIAGFIGRNVAQRFLNKKYNVTGIVSPRTNPNKHKDLFSKANIIPIDLADINLLKRYLSKNSFDVILHIGALRGGRNFPNEAYYDVNVNATEQIAYSALNTNAVLIFCSSVGVYGAIPKELPANILTEFQEDNYYHYTKIKAEAIIQKMVINGLKANIVRPAITYGLDDYGFPYTLTKLVHKKMLFIPDIPIRINLAHINLITDVFYKLGESEYLGNKIYNVADREPVKLKDLVDYISVHLRDKPYPNNRNISINYFRKMEKTFDSLGFTNQANRIRLISYSWFYDTRSTYKDLFISNINTLPGFQVVIDWYKQIKGINRN